MVRKFQLVAGHLALDFVNTLDNRYDRPRLVDLLPDYDSFLAFSRQSGILTGGRMRSLRGSTSASKAGHALEQIVELRETFYTLFLSVAHGKRPSTGTIRKLNRFLRDARPLETVHWRNGRLVRSYGKAMVSSIEPLWPILEAAINLLESPDSRRIHECSEKTCRWLFLDGSRNHSRRWCDMRICGNREKAKRFYSRVRHGA
jgi:predicted RNA-binding Zn ribbon-like protein